MVFVDLEFRKSMMTKTPLCFTMSGMFGGMIQMAGGSQNGWGLEGQGWKTQFINGLFTHKSGQSTLHVTSGMAIGALSNFQPHGPGLQEHVLPETKAELSDFFMTQPQKSQLCQRIYSHASQWHSSCEDSVATN